MPRRLAALFIVFAFVSLDVVALLNPVSASGTVTVSAWKCPATVDDRSQDAAVFAAACAEEAANSTFALTAGGVTRRRATAPGKPASWPAVTGAFSVQIDDGTGQQSAVFCKRGDGPVSRVDVVDGKFDADLTNDTGLACDWYLIPGGTPPPPEPTATATIAPTATSQAPAATVPPTATPRPTATSTGGGAPASPTSGELPPLPETIYPPAMYRANPERTGEQPGPGPVGDPALLWRYPIGDRPISSPVLSGGTIYIGGDAGLLAVYAASGTERWRFPTDRPVVATPSVVNGLVYFGSQDGSFACLDAQTGVERWRIQTGGMIVSSPLVVDGSAYFTSYDGNLYSVDAETGEVRWRHRFDATEFVPSPAFYDGTVIVGTGDIDGGYLYGIDAKSGDEVWRHQVAGAIGTTPAVVDGIVYFGSDDGFMYAYNMETQKRVWRVPTGKLIRSSAAVFGGVVYIGNRLGSLYAFDAASGDRLWEFESGDWVDSPPSFVGDVIYVGTKHRKLYVLNSADASIIWEYQMGSSITTSPIVVDSIVYFAARDGFLYAVGGSESAQASIQAAGETARPAKVPEEIIVNDGRYLFDRVLPLDLDGLSPIDQTGTMTVYASDSPTEAGAIYIQIEDRVEKGEEPDKFLARYLPEHSGDAGVTCLAEGPRNAAVISDGTSDYVFAGADPDLDVDALTEITSSNQLGSIYAESTEPPIRALYSQSSGVVQRYVLLDENGLPENLRGIVPFGGRVYQFSGDVTGEIDQRDLARVGCAGPFPIDVTARGADRPPTRLIAVVNDRLLAFDEIEQPAPESRD